MSLHEQFAEDLALHALGGLEGEERVALEKHLEGCAGCRGELERLRGDMALMALSTAGPMPPRRARQRLLEAVAREPRAVTTSARRRLVDACALGCSRGIWLGVGGFVVAEFGLAAADCWFAERIRTAIGRVAAGS